MFSIIDKYILKKFFSTFFYAIALILVITIAIDISENIDEFIEHHATFKEIVFDYYLNFLPYFGNMFIGLFVFISVIFFTSKMASNTEIIAILNSTVSFWRMLVPYMLGAFVVCIISLLLGNFVIPKTNKVKLAFEEKYIGMNSNINDYNIHRRLDKNTYVYFESYDFNKKTGYRFNLEKYSKQELIYKLNADFIKWDSIKNCWNLENVFERTISGMKEKIEKNTSKTLTLNLTPKDFNKRVENISTLNYFELNNFINSERSKGNDNIIFFEEEKHKRIALPFSTFVLTLIGVSVSSRKQRGGLGFHLGFGLALSFSYIFLMQIATKYALYGSFNIVLACWLPNIIYLIISLLLLRNAPK